MKVTDLDYTEYWKSELEGYNVQLIPMFIYLSILGIFIYAAIDYISVPQLWEHFAVLRLLLCAFGLLLIALFKSKKISAFWVESIFLVALYAFFAYGAARITDSQALMVWNMSISIGGVLWPVFILIRNYKNCFLTNLIFATLYLSFYQAYGRFTLLEILEFGGGFLMFVLALSPFVAYSRYKIYSDHAFLKHQLEAYATYDTLTGLYNRRIGITHLEKEMQQARRHKYALTIVYVDLDRLKQVNDTLGHEAGDEMIVTIAEHFKDGIRKSDIACRMGGDEFLLILHECDRESARRIITTIEDNLNQINETTTNLYRLSFSWGIAEYPYNDGMTFNDFLKMADDAMYENKSSKFSNIAASRHSI